MARKYSLRRVETRQHHPGYDIGEYSYGPLKILNQTDAKITIGKYCSFADGIQIILGLDHQKDWVSTYPFPAIIEFGGIDDVTQGPISKGDVHIGNDVWICQSAIILSNTAIADGSIVGAGSVVTKKFVDPYSVICGNPATIVGHRFPLHQRTELVKIKWWDWPFEKVVENLPMICSKNIQAFIDRHQTGG
jgi:acetyltransferase-like isoleucine patch superfamily enzyme